MILHVCVNKTDRFTLEERSVLINNNRWNTFLKGIFFLSDIILMRKSKVASHRNI